MVRSRRRFYWLSTRANRSVSRISKNVYHVVLGGGLQRAGEGEQCSDGALGWHALEHLSPSTARITRRHSQTACGYTGQVQVAYAVRSGVIESSQRLHQSRRGALGWPPPQSVKCRSSPTGRNDQQLFEPIALLGGWHARQLPI